MTNPEVFRSRTSLLLALVATVLSALLCGQVALSGENGGWLTALVAFATSLNAIWLLFVRPKIVFGNESLRIINPLTEVTLPWSSIEEIDSHLAFSVRANHKKFSAWAAPAPGRQHSRTLHSSELKGLGQRSGDSMKLSDSPKSDSGAAAFLARAKLAEYQAAKSAPLSQIEFKFNYLGIALMLAGLLTLTLLVA